MKKHYRLLPAHAIADSLGEEKARALPFFHTFSGCFTSLPFSSVLGRKRLGTPGEFSLILHTHLWSYPRWQHQSQRSESVSLKDSSFFFMTKHVNAHTWMKQERYFLWKGGRYISYHPQRPPLRNMLSAPRTRQDTFGAKHWQLSSSYPTQVIGMDKECQWWMGSLPEPAKFCKELLKCSCRKAYRPPCKCLTASLQCTELCNCAGTCFRAERGQC